MNAYARILRAPHMRPLFLSMLLTRLPLGLNGLATVLFLRERTGSYTTAGLVSAAFALGGGAGAPLSGRLVDRFGQRRVLVPLAFVHATALGAVIGFAELGAPTVVLVAC